MLVTVRSGGEMGRVKERALKERVGGDSVSIEVRSSLGFEALAPDNDWHWTPIIHSNLAAGECSWSGRVFSPPPPVLLRGSVPCVTLRVPYMPPLFALATSWRAGDEHDIQLQGNPCNCGRCWGKGGMSSSVGHSITITPYILPPTTH